MVANPSIKVAVPFVEVLDGGMLYFHYVCDCNLLKAVDTNNFIHFKNGLF
jgi:hypothetical protein